MCSVWALRRICIKGFAQMLENAFSDGSGTPNLHSQLEAVV